MSGRSDFTASPTPGQQPAPASRHDHGRRLGRLLDDLEAERGLAGDDGGVVEGGHEEQAALGGHLLRVRDAVLERAVDEDDLGLVAARGGLLGERRVRRA